MSLPPRTACRLHPDVETIPDPWMVAIATRQEKGEGCAAHDNVLVGDEEEPVSSVLVRPGVRKDEAGAAAWAFHSTLCLDANGSEEQFLGRSSNLHLNLLQ